MEQRGLIDKLAVVGKSKPTQSAVEFVVSSIKQLIIGGDLVPGDRLPSENEMTKLLSVSRSSLREAKKVLSMLGVVEIRRGDGTYVTDSSDSAALDSLLMNFALSRPSLKEIYDLRRIIERGVMQMAIANATEPQIGDLEACLREMEANASAGGADAGRMGDLDVRFHCMLGRLTRNRLVEKIYSYIMHYLAATIVESHRNQGGSENAIASHSLIVDVLKTRDAARIEEVTRMTVDTWFHLIAGKYAQGPGKEGA
jgi:DNA-binding FadR family transcriptional regulator